LVILEDCRPKKSLTPHRLATGL